MSDKVDHVATKENTEVKNFKETAKQIIKDSIRSAICIDDGYASAYSQEEELNSEEPKKLYESFREDGHCDLDIYQYKSLEESWKKDYMLSNKDLMILDWELNNTGISKFEDTLVILEDVIKSNLIPFVVIYTNTEDIHSVGKELITNFNFIEEDIDISAFYECLNTNFKKISKEEEVDFEIFLDDNINSFYEYIINKGGNEAIKETILNNLKGALSIKDQMNLIGIERKLKFVLDKKGYKGVDPISFLGVLWFNQQGKQGKSVYSLTKIESGNLVFKINNTTVLIYHKKDQGGIEPELLFQKFSEAIISNPHNYLTLLSLELKDHLREAFSKIGSKFSSINEQAFFYHIQNFKNQEDFDKEAIHDFIIESWMQDLNTNKLNGKSKVIDLVEDAFSQKENDIPKELNDQLTDELVKYSAYLSTNNWDQKRTKLGFGDLFFSAENDNYFLCITPHCDCVNPESKINNNFYFIKGNKTNNKEAISNAEQGFYSFLNINNEAICLEWSTKPFTVYIEKNDIQNLNFQFKGKSITLEGLAIIKENFTQRLSNESFGYGYRVGINLPHKVVKIDPSKNGTKCDC